MNKYMEMMLYQAREVSTYNDKQWADKNISQEQFKNLVKECPFCTADAQENAFRSGKQTHPDCLFCPLMNLAKGSRVIIEAILYRCDAVGATFLEEWENKCDC